MKKTYLAAVLSLFSWIATAQNFQIENLGTTYTQQEIETAFSGANLCGQMFETQSRSITLDDGAKLTLLPNSCGHADGTDLTPVTWAIRSNKVILAQEGELTKTRKKLHN